MMVLYEPKRVAETSIILTILII